MSREIFVNFGSGNSMVSIRQQAIYLNQGRLIQVDSSTLSEIRINIETFSWGNLSGNAIWKVWVIRSGLYVLTSKSKQLVSFIPTN